MFEVVPDVHGLLYLEGIQRDEGVAVVFAAYTPTLFRTYSLRFEAFTVIVFTFILFALALSLRFLCLADGFCLHFDCDWAFPYRFLV